MERRGHEADCADVVQRLYHFLDGELDEVRRALVQCHLDECLPCLEAFDFEAELRQVIARKCREPVPEQLRMRVHLAIHTDLRPEQQGGRGILPS